MFLFDANGAKYFLIVGCWQIFLRHQKCYCWVGFGFKALAGIDPQLDVELDLELF